MNRYSPDIHHRRSIRLRGYDYSQTGVYFVTLCVQNRQTLLGDIVDDEMTLSAFGAIVSEEWRRSSEIRSEIALGEYVIMPNHFHAIVHIVEHHDIRADGDVNANRNDNCRDGNHPNGNCRGDRPVAPTGPTPRSIGALMAGFKSAVTKRINTIRNTPGVPVWQRNYYEHIIRNQADYNRIAEYIVNNPRRWQEDSLHPANQTIDGTNATDGRGNGGHHE